MNPISCLIVIFSCGRIEITSLIRIPCNLILCTLDYCIWYQWYLCQSTHIIGGMKSTIILSGIPILRNKCMSVHKLYYKMDQIL